MSGRPWRQPSVTEQSGPYHLVVADVYRCHISCARRVRLRPVSGIADDRPFRRVLRHCQGELYLLLTREHLSRPAEHRLPEDMVVGTDPAAVGRLRGRGELVAPLLAAVVLPSVGDARSRLLLQSAHLVHHPL